MRSPPVHASTDHAQLAGCSKLAQLLPVLLLDVVRPARYAVRFWRHRCRQTQGLHAAAQAGSACEPKRGGAAGSAPCRAPCAGRPWRRYSGPGHRPLLPPGMRSRSRFSRCTDRVKWFESWRRTCVATSSTPAPRRLHQIRGTPHVVVSLSARKLQPKRAKRRP